MDKLMWLLIIVAVIFVLSYNPKSGTLEKFVELTNNRPQQEKKLCCGANDYRGANPEQCENSYYQNLQFLDDTVACPRKPTNSWKGALLAQDDSGPAVIGV
jgi:hypothetical protein